MANDFINNKDARDRPIFFLFLIINLEVLIAYIISCTSTTDNIFAHLMIVPIILAAGLFDYKVSILSSVIAELLIAVLSPSEVGLANTQQIQISVYRAILFIVTGLTVNFLKNRAASSSQQPKTIGINPYRDLPCWDSFHKTIEAIIQNKEIVQIRLFLIEICNQSELLSTFSIGTNIKINQEIIGKIKSEYRNSKTFYVRSNTFGLMLTQIHQNIQSLIQKLEEPILVNGIPVHCEITIGEASYPDSGYTPDDMLRNCFLALNKAKQHQKPYHQFNPKLFNPETPVMLGQFQVAIEKKEIDFHYQPIIQKKGKVVALEALVRWNHPIRGLIPPNDFIPDLEFTRITNLLTYYSLETNLERMKKLYKMGFDIDITLNISITNLFQPDFASKVIALTEENNFPAHHLTLEITERGFLSDDPESQRNLNTLLHYGVNVSMDDFGAGSTSISNFGKKGITSIKIDRSFIKDIHIHKNNQAILEGLISIAKSSNISTIAEGVEITQERDKVLELGFDCLQGYLIARPLDFNAISKWLKKYSEQNDH